MHSFFCFQASGRFDRREASVTCKNVRILKAVLQGVTKPLDLALVALLQPSVSNKIPGCYFSKLDHQPQGGTINTVFCACLTNAKGNAGLVSYLSKSAT
jgi:hypothetical protein